MEATAQRFESSELRLSDPIDDAYDAWKHADAEARAVAFKVNDLWQRHDRGGPPPSRDLLREAAWLRHQAAERLAHAIQMLLDAGLIQPSKGTARPRRLRAPVAPTH